jgi:hypothetical protein
MGPKFSNPVLLPTGQLQIGGVFDTHGEVVEDVLIRFLLIPDDMPIALTEPIIGTATIANAALASRGDPDSTVTHGEFSETVENKFGLRAGHRARGIATSIAVKASDAPDPPAFETFTWCVNVEVQPQAAQAPAT